MMLLALLGPSPKTPAGPKEKPIEQRLLARIQAFHGELGLAATLGTAATACLCFTPDGTALVCSNLQGLVVWSAATGELKATLKEAVGSVMSIAFSPDGKVMVTGNSDRTVKLWRAR